MNKVKLLLCAAVFFVACNKKEKNRICDVYAAKQGYEIGTVESLTSMPLKVTYKYTYTVNGTAYNGKEKAYGIGQKDERMIGRKFIVVYNLDNPGESDLNTNYAIEQADDFSKHTAAFKTTPATPDYPSKKCK